MEVPRSEARSSRRSTGCIHSTRRPTPELPSCTGWYQARRAISLNILGLGVQRALAHEAPRLDRRCCRRLRRRAERPVGVGAGIRRRRSTSTSWTSRRRIRAPGTTSCASSTRVRRRLWGHVLRGRLRESDAADVQLLGDQQGRQRQGLRVDVRSRPDTASIRIGRDLEVDAPTFQCHVPIRSHRREADRAARRISRPDARGAARRRARSTTRSRIASLTRSAGRRCTAATRPPTYVAAAAYYTTAAYQPKWTRRVRRADARLRQHLRRHVLRRRLRRSPVARLACAITKSTGNVKSCAWMFGGSYTLSRANGALDQTSKTFTCPSTMHGTISQLISALTAAGSTMRSSARCPA